jgi:hypothetical protein
MSYINYFKILIKRINEYFLYKNTRQIKSNELEFMKNIVNSEGYQPVFFLSTGRTGTEFFTKLLSKSKKVQIFHSPSNLFCNAQSELIEQGKTAYEMYIKYGFEDERTNKLVSQAFLAAREQLLFTTYLHNKVYIETNNRITFLAPAIKSIFPNAKFVFLYRHPGEFIRSGKRRNYYKSNSMHELGRLEPIENTQYYKAWSSFDDIKKIAWLWNETNTYIDDFLLTLNNDNYFKFNFNKLNDENIENLLEFLNIKDINKNEINKSLTIPVNVQKSGSFPKYTEWKLEDKDKVIEICKELSLKYGYKL